MATNDKTAPTDEAAEGSWSPRSDEVVTSTKADSGGSSDKGSSDEGSKDKGSSDSSGPADPDQLVADIERTRENLAETLDAIVEKVNPRRVVEEKKQQARADAQEAVQTAKDGAATAAQSVKAAAAHAAEAVKEGVASVKEKIGGGDDDAVRSPLAPATSVELGAATPVDDSTAPGAVAMGTVPAEPAPTTGTLSDTVRTQPSGSGIPPYAPMIPPAVASNAPVLAGAGAGALAAVTAVLVLLRRRRRR